jgi:glycosyltransferase 2 family protein
VKHRQCNQNRWSADLGRRARLQTAVVGTLIGLGCVALVLRQVDLKQSWNTLGRLNGPFLIVPIAVFFANLPLRAWRWQTIFPASSRPRFGSCLVVLGIGNMANFLLPGRAGDIARCVLLGSDTTLSGSSRTLATLAVEKILDGFALVAMVLFAAWSLHPPHWVFQLLRVGIFVFGGAMLAVILLRYRARSLTAYATRLLRRLHVRFLEDRVGGLLTSFADGLSAVSSARQMLFLFVLTAAIWITEALLVWGLAGSLELGISVRSAIVASAVLGLGLMIPAAPGGLGTYELFGTEAFKLTGIAASSALALTLVIHAWVYVANITAGVCLLALKGMSLAQLRRQVAEEAPSTAQP